MSDKELEMKWLKKVETKIDNYKKKLEMSNNSLEKLYQFNLDECKKVFNDTYQSFERGKYQFKRSDKEPLVKCITKIQENFHEMQKKISERKKIQIETNNYIKQSKEIISDLNNNSIDKNVLKDSINKFEMFENHDYSSFYNKNSDIKQIFTKLELEQRNLNYIKPDKFQSKNDLDAKYRIVEGIINKIKELDLAAYKNISPIIDEFLETNDKFEMNIIIDRLYETYEGLKESTLTTATYRSNINDINEFIEETIRKEIDITVQELVKKGNRVIYSNSQNKQKENGYCIQIDSTNDEYRIRTFKNGEICDEKNDPTINQMCNDIREATDKRDGSFCKVKEKNDIKAKSKTKQQSKKNRKKKQKERKSSQHKYKHIK